MNETSSTGEEGLATFDPWIGIAVLFECAGCGCALGEYQFVPATGNLIPVEHENALPDPPGFRRASQSGRYTGTYAVETVEVEFGVYVHTWKCGGRSRGRCGTPSIAVLRLRSVLLKAESENPGVDFHVVRL